MKYVPWGLALALLVGYGWQQREAGRAEAVAKVWQASAKYWKGEALRVDSVYRVEVSDLANQLIAYEKLRDTVRITDTVWVKRFIRVADSTIAACTKTVATCDKKVEVRDSLIANQNRQIQALLKKKPSVWSKLPWLVGGYLIHEVTD
jgi:hypothetical protein